MWDLCSPMTGRASPGARMHGLSAIMVLPRYPMPPYIEAVLLERGLMAAY
jgi:hypothetical protein